MIKRLSMAVVASLIVMMLLPVAAQPESGDVALYTERMTLSGRQGDVLLVAGDGTLTALPVPGGLYPPGYPATFMLGELALSPDDTHLAAAYYSLEGGGSAPQIVIASLSAGSCCVTVAPPLAEVYAYDLAGFSPDGSQLAFSYVGAPLTADVYASGGMAIADANTGALLNVLDINDAMAGIGESPGAAWALMGGWTADGIQWTPSCYACEPPLEAQWSLWLPHKATLIARTSDGFSLWADTLAGTGESLYISQVAGFPISPEPEGMFAIPNVVQYLPGGTPPSGAALIGAPVVFFDAATLNLGGGAHWVDDGRAFLVTPDTTARWALQNRAGVQQPIPVPSGARFLAGTASGWLAALPGGSEVQLVRYVVSGTSAFGAVIDRTTPSDSYRGAYYVLRAPELGMGLTPTVPPSIEPPVGVALTVPAPVPTAEFVVQCPGFLPSRLTPGGTANVTPGDPNNLRALPSASAPLVGRIPGGAQLSVITGPVCDPAGMAWWQVMYNGLIGWTAEGQGTTYFLEPAAQG